MHRISHIIESLQNGQFKQAKTQTQYLCKTVPERQARRVGQVVGALCDPDGNYKNPDLALQYLQLFGGD